METILKSHQRWSLTRILTVVLMVSVLSSGATGCDSGPRGLLAAWRTAVYRFFAHDRPRGVDPPPVGTDAIPGLDIRHPRPAPPVLHDVTPGELVLIPAGPFQMGNDTVPDERPRHQVDLPAYRIEKTEVSTGQFRNFVEQGGYDDPTVWSARGWAWKQDTGARPMIQGRPDPLPMVNVSYYEAQAYARWAGRRLPTEAEWEKAARGTDGRTFPWGNDHDPTRSNHWLYKLAPPTFKDLAWPVASWPQGQSPYGLLHAAGNVWEWTQSSYSGNGYGGDSSATSPHDNRAAPPAADNDGQGPTWLTIRGGSWATLLSYQRTTAREPARPDERRPTLGFRCVAEVDTGSAPP